MSEKIFQQVPAPVLTRYTDEEMRTRSKSFLNSLSNRRTIRDFSDKLMACPPKVVPSVKLVFVQTERNKEYDT